MDLISWYQHLRFKGETFLDPAGWYSTIYLHLLHPPAGVGRESQLPGGKSGGRGVGIIPLSWWKHQPKNQAVWTYKSWFSGRNTSLNKLVIDFARSWTKWSSEPIFPQAWTPATKHLRNLPSNNSWAVIIPGHLPSCAEGDGSFWFSLSSMASSGKVKLFFIEVYPWDQAFDRMAFHQV